MATYELVAKGGLKTKEAEPDPPDAPRRRSSGAGNSARPVTRSFRPANLDRWP
jgi:hypothetical protein